MRPLHRTKPIPNPALGLQPQEQLLHTIHHPPRPYALLRPRIPQLERKVHRATPRTIRKLQALAPALAHRATVLKRLPRIALQRVGQAAVIVRIVLLVRSHVVPACDLGGDLGPHELVEDITVAKQYVVLNGVSVSAAGTGVTVQGGNVPSCTSPARSAIGRRSRRVKRGGT